MPAAINRAALIAITEKEFSKLTTLLAGVDSNIAQRPFCDGTSIKDIISHRAHWTNLFFDWYQQGQETGKADIPAKGYKWNQLKEYNADLRKQNADVSWKYARMMLEKSHAHLILFIESKTDKELYEKPMQGGGSKWTTGRWAEAAGASHYRSAAKYIRKCMREMAN
ncbi:MAG TPA: DfsB family protein [Rhodobacteraceae bacterium]|jgi:hypothetical protein|nr:DfsB family protein [Paracoccaceae bacterium]